MATRIVHISDLHFPAKSEAQVVALGRSISDMAPDLIVVTGDLTRNGKREEFRQAKAFVNSLSAPTLIIPGNHDIPVPGIWARITAPFARFETYFSPSQPGLETPDLVVIGLNTSVGWQAGLDWSLGYILPDRLKRASALLSAENGSRVRIVACHHPLHQHPLDPVRSRTFGGVAAFDELCAAGMDLLLHGHLHRTDRRCFPAPDERDVYEVCANTALANRQRGGPAGYNIIDVEDRRWVLSVVGWVESQYRVLPPISLAKPGNPFTRQRA